MKGHSGHMIAQCQDFWGAENCIERRKLMAETGCYTCLGRDQGCGAGACAIVEEVPKDTICQECANFTNRTGPPLSRNLCCGPEPLGPVRTEFDVCLKSTLFN